MIKCKIKCIKISNKHRIDYLKEEIREAFEEIATEGGTVFQIKKIKILNDSQIFVFYNVSN